MTNAKETAKRILDDSYVGTMATISENRPHSRYMTFFNDNFTLYTATSKKTDKVDELEANPHTHILIGYEGEGLGDTYLEIRGNVTISDDPKLIDKVWNEHMKGWFSGPDDPDLTILKITPDTMRLLNKKGKPPEIIEF